jgi:hypothetical protein
MTCTVLNRLCSSVGRPVTDFLLKGFSHEPNPLGISLFLSDPRPWPKLAKNDLLSSSFDVTVPLTICST